MGEWEYTKNVSIGVLAATRFYLKESQAKRQQTEQINIAHMQSTC